MASSANLTLTPTLSPTLPLTRCGVFRCLYALSTGDQDPHLESGGETGGITFFGNHTTDGVLYEILDEDLQVLADTTLQGLVDDWKANT